jgi:N-acetylmuramoyl-L-alanine amidase
VRRLLRIVAADAPPLSLSRIGGYVMAKISYDDYLRMLRNPDTSDQEIMDYSVVVPGATAFEPEIRPNPDLVEMTQDDHDLEDAMQIGNGLARFRRQLRFRRRLRAGKTLPVLVSEGDSWFQFPLLVQEVIDQLDNDYLIWSVGAAGDTLNNMVNASAGQGRTEYLQALRQQKDKVKAFLFSAAGNDIIGEDPHTEQPVLLQLLRPFNGDAADVLGHVNLAELGRRLDFLRTGYAKVIETIRAEPGLDQLPILIHGYDYTFPYPWGANDPRKPRHAERNAWLGKPLDDLGIQDQELRRNVIKLMLDGLYDMLGALAGDSDQTRVYVVDCRHAMPNVSDWIDEIHGTSEGFAKVAERFKAVLAAVV